MIPTGLCESSKLVDAQRTSAAPVQDRKCARKVMAKTASWKWRYTSLRSEADTAWTKVGRTAKAMVEADRPTVQKTVKLKKGDRESGEVSD